MTGIADEIRLARPGERDEIIGLANRVFRPLDGVSLEMEKALPLFFAPENIPEWAVAVTSQGIVAGVGAHRLEVRAGPYAYQAAHIGAVCTEQRYRGKGIASELLALETAHLRSRGVDLAFISGDRSLYRQAGAGSAGLACWFELPPRPGDHLPVRELASTELGEMASLYLLEPVAIARSSDTWLKGIRAVPDQPGWERVLAGVGTPLEAYVVLDWKPGEGRAEIRELAGVRSLAVQAALSLAGERNCRRVSIPAPAWDRALIHELTSRAATRPAESAFPGTYLLVDPVSTARRLLSVAAQIDPALGEATVLAEDDRFRFSDGSGGSRTGDGAWVGQLLFGDAGRRLSHALPVPMPWWLGVSYG